ncbi:MAG: hypothetical protein N0C84_24670 [Candidatus Thiodiazotropha taylori]|uniref:Flagellar hook-length control protein FliK n=1 Tax=Candidatus Thiodiazotropha taylori TaxID=2792791 RepID=A0A9E4N8Q4_9GAMM|nr:hypothetical protein [Candidatus Thiodiazotropha taylori]MCW4259665.1 hypothetical protein [Candidatus Thiodiazotropha taylori]
MPFSIAKILPPLPTATSAKSLLEAIQPGQLLKGTALSENLNGAMRLQIGVTQLTAQTTLSVTPGQSLLLQVEKAGKLPELRDSTHPEGVDCLGIEEQPSKATASAATVQSTYPAGLATTDKTPTGTGQTGNQPGFDKRPVDRQA